MNWKIDRQATPTKLMNAEQRFDAQLGAQRDSYLRGLKNDLAGIEQLIVDLSRPDGAGERTRKLARAVHSIKAVAGSYGLELISLAVDGLQDELAIQGLVDGDSEIYIDRLLQHKHRLARLVEAYLANDNPTLRDIQSMYARPALDPAARPLDAPLSLSRVLLVDPSQATLKICAGVLNAVGVRAIATAQDGYEALGRLLKEPFDAVITSLHVPTIDGQSLTPVLRTIPGPNRKTPVILLTASTAALDPSAARPDYIVEKNPHMTGRLKTILSELKGAAKLDAAPTAPKLDGVLKKIVLVDDSKSIHQLLRISFKRFAEIQIATLADPTTAVDFVRSEKPDLVLLDVNMPQASGEDVFREISASADLQDIPVAFLTAEDSAQRRDELSALGAWQVFKKPFLPKTFAAQLIKLFSER